jgi:hypothetical protein
LWSNYIRLKGESAVQVAMLALGLQIQWQIAEDLMFDEAILSFI